MKRTMNPETIKHMREKGFIEWLREDAWNWGEYQTDVEPPLHDAPEKQIRRYVEDVKDRAEEIHQELIDDGADEFDTEFDSPMWPLEDDAPLEAVRAYLKYLEENAEAGRAGMVID